MRSGSVVEILGVRISLPDSWTSRRLGDNSVVLLPLELAAHDPETASTSILIRQTQLLKGEEFESAVFGLMHRRIGQGDVELESADQGLPGIKCGWTDGIAEIVSYFVPLADSFTEICFAVAPGTTGHTLATVQEEVRISPK